jgi:TonB family protein
MNPTLQKILYALFRHPKHRPAHLKTTSRLKRNFVLMRIHVGENGQVRDIVIKMSCGNPQLDQMAIQEGAKLLFAQPRVGRNAMAKWHNMRWEVPKNLR